MAIEPVTELGARGALWVPRARVVPVSAPPASYTAAVERYLTGDFPLVAWRCEGEVEGHGWEATVV